MAVAAATPWQVELLRSARRLGAGLWAGFLCGAIIGGAGGRLAMFVLRLTSDPRLVGTKTDDGFVIGEFTGDTIFLVGLTTLAGALGGLFYLGVRPWLPEHFRTKFMAVFGAAVGGALVIHPDGIDFTRLEPLWLAVAMFIAIPALYGAAMSSLTERLFTAREAPAGRYGWALLLLGPLPVLIMGPIGWMTLAVLIVGWVLNRRGDLSRVWSSQPAVWIGRAALLSVILWALATLAKDVLAILG